MNATPFPRRPPLHGTEVMESRATIDEYKDEKSKHHKLHFSLYVCGKYSNCELHLNFNLQRHLNKNYLENSELYMDATLNCTLCGDANNGLRSLLHFWGYIAHFIGYSKSSSQLLSKGLNGDSAFGSC